MAGTRIAEAFVAVSADMAGLSAGMRQGQAITTSAVNSMQRSLGGLQSMLGMIGVGVGFGAIIGGIRGTIAEAQTAMDSQTRLAAAVETSGKAAGFTAGQLATFATELQNATTAGDETIKDAMTTLTTFPKVAGEMFKRATRAALDMQEKGFGGMGGNARMLGRALEDPRRGLMMLTRMGVTFSEQQRKQIKDLMEQNKLGEAQQVIMGAVEGKFKGVAEAMAKTPSGRIKQLTEATGDLREEIGTRLMPLMVRWKETQFALTKSVLSFVEWAAPMVGGFADQWARLNESTGGFAGKIAVGSAAILTLIPLISMAGRAVAMLFPTDLFLLPIRLIGTLGGMIGGLTKPLFAVAAVLTGTFSAAWKNLQARLFNVIDHAHNMGRIFGSIVQQGTVSAFNLLGVGAERLGAGLQKAGSIGVSALARIDAAARAIPWQAMWTGATVAFTGIRTAAMVTWAAIQSGASTTWMLVRNTMDPAYLRATWDGIKVFAAATWQSISATAQGAWSVIKTTFDPAYLKAVWDGWRSGGESMWSRIKAGALNTWQTIKNTFDPAYLKATWVDMKTAAMNAWTSIKTRFSALGPQIGAALRTGVNMAWTGIVAAGKATFTTLGSLAAKTGAMMGRSLRAVGGGISGIAGGLAGLSMMGGAFAFLAPFQTMLIVIPQVMSLLGSVGMVVGALASPFGLVAGAIVGGLALWTRYSETGKEALDSVKNAFGPVWDTATDTFGGIKDAMASGDLKLAGQIGMAGLQSVFYQGMNGILSRWGEWAKATVEVFAGAMNQVATLWITTQGKISKGILSMAENKGVVGDVMAKLLGVDIREEKAVDDRKRAQKQALSEQVRVWTEAKDQAVAQGGTVEFGGQQRSQEELQGWIDQALAKMQQEGYGLTDQQLEVAGAEEARAAIDQEVQNSLSAIDEMTANAITAYDEFASTAGDKATEAEAELARLRQEALDKRAQLEKDRAAKEEADKKASLADVTAPGDGEEEAPVAKQKDPFVGFAELNRKMQEAMLKDTVAQDTLDVAKDQRDLLQKIADGFDATKQGAVSMLGPGLASAGANAFAASPIAGGLGEVGKFGSALVDSLFKTTQPPTAPGQQGDGSKETVSVLDKIRVIMDTVAKNTAEKPKTILAGA